MIENQNNPEVIVTSEDSNDSSFLNVQFFLKAFVLRYLSSQTFKVSNSTCDC